MPAIAYASLGDRTLAVLLDALVLLAVFWAVGMWLAPRFGGLTAEGFNLQGRPALIIIGLSLLALVAYYVCFEWWFGATLGKFVAGVKVRGVDGGRLGFQHSLVRNLLRVIDALGVYLVAAIFVLMTKRHQRLGDMGAGTVAVKRDYPRLGRAAALVVLLALPVAAIVGTWSLRTAAVGGSTSTSSTLTASASSGSGSAQATAADAQQAAPGGVLRGAADGPFVMSGLRLAADKDGPERPSGTFKAGETPTLLFDVRGFATDETKKGRVKLIIGARDPDGVAIKESEETEVEPPASASSLHSWASVTLPTYAVPGEYRLDVTMADLVGNRKIQVSVPFRVEGMPFEPSDTLTVRNFRLTDGEDGPPRADSTYRTGDTLWMAFDLVGFKADQDRGIRVQEALVVASPGGERGAEQQVLDLDQRFFYVPRRLPITTHISLGGATPGKYEAMLTFTDRIGNQRFQQVVRFTIVE